MLVLDLAGHFIRRTISRDLHVATALHLAAEQFLTFDGKQRSLAEAEGMVVPV